MTETDLEQLVDSLALRDTQVHIAAFIVTAGWQVDRTTRSNR